MEWNQIEWDKKLWNIPSTLTKNKKPHSLPLSELAFEVIREIPRIDDQNFVFPSRGSRPSTFSGFSRSKRRFDQKLQIEPWRLHDLRRTVATGMAELGVAPHVVERVLNHSSGTFAGVAGVYNRFGYLDEMREALVAWEGKLQDLAAQQPPKG